MIYDDEMETLPREALEALQLKRLKALLGRVYATVPFYGKKFDECGVKPEDINSLSDLRKLPFTTKDDLRENYPFNMLAVPMEQVIRIHASSGTTGKPTVICHSRRDIETWANLAARSLMATGVAKGDIIQNAYGYGLFTGGLGTHYGAEKIGAATIPMSGGNTKLQIQVMHDFKSTVLTCTPSYSLYLGEMAEEMGYSKDDIYLRIGVLGAEPWSENIRKQIEGKLGIDALDIYGLSEMMGPGVAIECKEAKHGLHIWEDHFIPEIINPDTGEVLPEGKKGELVITTLTREATPLVRYRTKDITYLIKEPCICGRTHSRIARISGRTDDMLIIRGVNVFPSQIEQVLMQVEGVEPHYQLIIDSEKGLTTLEVRVEVSENVFSDEVKKLESLKNKIQAEIKEHCMITTKVTLAEPKSIERSVGKAKRIIDKRKM
jgi:phenylacetate-CoA ligase